MSDQAEAANRLAQIHYQSMSTSAVYVAHASVELRDQADEPIKLLEVDEETIPSGIVPLRFAPLPESGILYRSVIIEVTPEEHEQIEDGRLQLPEGWEELQLIRRLPETASTDE